MSTYKLIIDGGTDCGLVRGNNEDSIHFEQFNAGSISLMQVADGVGGNEGGEVASRIAVDSVRAFVSKAITLADSGGGYPEEWASHTLKQAVIHANQMIRQEQSNNPLLDNMATTLVAVLQWEAQLVVCNLGDSRAYFSRNGALSQMTHDQTVAQQLYDQGIINHAEYIRSPYQHVLSQALGLQARVDPECVHIHPQLDDVILLCSDGLTGCLSDEQIQLCLDDTSSLSSAVDKLITRANDAGGHDNISVVLAGVGNL